MVEQHSSQLPPWTKFLWDINQITNPQPKFIEVDLTNYCNKNCTWCVSEEIRKQKPLNMSFDLAMDIIDEAITHQWGIVFTGGGEPTLHPDFQKICQVVIDLVNNGLLPQMGLITNGGKDWKNVEWYLEHTTDPPAWVRVSVNYWTIAPELKVLLKKYPNRIGISIIYDNNNEDQLFGAIYNDEELEEYPIKFSRVKSAHDMIHSTRDPLTCQARKFVKIYETDGSQPYCCLARGFKGQPPKICPKGCPWNVDINSAWKFNPCS